MKTGAYWVVAIAAALSLVGSGYLFGRVGGHKDSSDRAKSATRSLEDTSRVRVQRKRAPVHISSATDQEPEPTQATEQASGEIEAPPEPPTPKTAVEERDHFVSAVESSGPAPGTLLEQIRDVEREWTATVGDSNALALGAWRCFSGGCTMSVAIKDEDAAAPILAKLRTSQAGGIQGPRFQSGTVTSPSGGQEVTMILFTSPPEFPEP